MNPQRLMLELALQCEALKSSDIISDYELSAEETNFRVDPQGELCSDLIITNKVIPKRTLKHINVDVTILPSNGKGESRTD